MLLHRYSHERDVCDVWVTVEEAFRLLEEQYTCKEDAENFIGFTHPDCKDAFIQFIRQDKVTWVIDIPVFEDDTYQGSLTGSLSHDTVFLIVMEFFNANSEFQKNIIGQNYNLMLSECKSKWGIILELIQDN